MKYKLSSQNKNVASVLNYFNNDKEMLHLFETIKKHYNNVIIIKKLLLITKQLFKKLLSLFIL